ncbi:hypothetical protein JKP88DRAFT_282906 [Tribonema minus]|uniref:Fibronectin type-III domain-containing protein n=1 Tax=Tribonema minus TaxID=303371 RepID=A0A836C8X6_9STRA|nr:hypothetical protein JKP88DRAFT_282906 [Tribonema minus]
MSAASTSRRLAPAGGATTDTAVAANNVVVAVAAGTTVYCTTDGSAIVTHTHTLSPTAKAENTNTLSPTATAYTAQATIAVTAAKLRVQCTAQNASGGLSQTAFLGWYKVPAPAAPAVVTTLTTTTITFTFSAPAVPQVTSYLAQEYDANGVAKGALLTVNTPAAAITVTGKAASVKYYFKFSAKGVGGTSAQSATVAITTPSKNSPLSTGTAVVTITNIKYTAAANGTGSLEVAGTRSDANAAIEVKNQDGTVLSVDKTVGPTFKTTAANLTVKPTAVRANGPNLNGVSLIYAVV